jgi:CheY-like chemotaxis protein
MKHILIAEDEAFNRIVIEDMLNLFYSDIEIRTVENGEEALASIEAGWPDLVLSDIDMPRMSGMELIEHVRKGAHSGITMVCITAFAIAGDKEKLLMSGYDAYISKPIEMDTLQRVLDPYLK